MNIHIWNDSGKQTVSIDDCLKITAQKSIFYVTCKNDLSGEINLDDFNTVLKIKPEIVDEKALELKEVREKLKVLFGNQ